jgi:hypothetical protein
MKEVTVSDAEFMVQKEVDVTGRISGLQDYIGRTAVVVILAR